MLRCDVGGKKYLQWYLFGFVYLLFHISTYSKMAPKEKNEEWNKAPSYFLGVMPHCTTRKRPEPHGNHQWSHRNVYSLATIQERRHYFSPQPKPTQIKDIKHYTIICILHTLQLLQLIMHCNFPRTQKSLHAYHGDNLNFSHYEFSRFPTPMKILQIPSCQWMQQSSHYTGLNHSAAKKVELSQKKS